MDVQWALLGGVLRRVVPGLRMRVLGRVAGTGLAVLGVVTLRVSRATS